MRFKFNDALLLVDPQIDFFPSGALPVPEGDKILPTLNALIEAAIEADIPIILTRDWHPKNHCSFTTQGGPFPEHCIQGTHGAEFHPGLNIPESTIVISKAFTPDNNSMSGFQGGVTKDDQSLLEVLKQSKINRVWIAGLTLEYCVKLTALDAKQAGYATHVILPGTLPITAEAGEAAKKELKKAGIALEHA